MKSVLSIDIASIDCQQHHTYQNVQAHISNLPYCIGLGVSETIESFYGKLHINY